MSHTSQAITVSSLIHLCAMALEADTEGCFQSQLDELVNDAAHHAASTANNVDESSSHDDVRHDAADRHASTISNQGYSAQVSYLVDQGYTPVELAQRLAIAQFARIH